MSETHQTSDNELVTFFATYAAAIVEDLAANKTRVAETLKAILNAGLSERVPMRCHADTLEYSANDLRRVIDELDQFAAALRSGSADRS